MKRSSDGAVVDRRTARTRRSLLNAFIELVLERGYSAIGIGDIVKRADIGRSTFYAHFRSKDELLIASMQWMFDVLADATTPGAAREPLNDLVAHFWSNRRLARVVLSHPIEPKLRRALTATIQHRLALQASQGLRPDQVKPLAICIATAQLGLLTAWTTGEVVADQTTVVEALLTAATSMQNGTPAATVPQS